MRAVKLRCGQRGAVYSDISFADYMDSCKFFFFFFFLSIPSKIMSLHALHLSLLSPTLFTRDLLCLSLSRLARLEWLRKLAAWIRLNVQLHRDCKYVALPVYDVL
jgi:hypothetical protein